MKREIQDGNFLVTHASSLKRLGYSPGQEKLTGCRLTIFLVVSLL